MLWLRKMGAARSAAFHNVHDAAILWFTMDPPFQVDATVVRQGSVSQISTTDENSITRARRAVENIPPWVPVTSETKPKWLKYVHLDRVTDVVLEEDGGKRKLVLSIAYVAPDKPFEVQSYVCGEIHERALIADVLDRLGHDHDTEDEGEELVVAMPTVAAAPRAKKKTRGA